MSQDLALGEVQSLAQKAARGAGRAVGVAEDAGRAVRWLCARGYDGAGALDALLHASDGAGAEALAPELPDLQTQRAGICPLILGGYLSDTGIVPETETGAVFAPLLLAPALAFIAVNGCIVLRCEGGGEVRVSADNLSGPALPLGPCAISAHRDAAPVPRPAFRTRVNVAAETFTSLLSFAARTYAPATEASRARGAGAGTTDND